ncbi:S-layer homology domain-containing protein [Paenibacillus roseipurpureus]|uniref:S-layer homology domain-containing protein n=1 Tax=Paenibacillus roseopurpureus TaxID=2918901 RepID=A0AA96LIH8_9BACL|nr:S-layer homology domain-containing protein [Paenibacillus sp. MBLB1832]WNR42377.1 S-layer homology domain-containing protein [Paenibacillus sp. MBLB1832]
MKRRKHLLATSLFVAAMLSSTAMLASAESASKPSIVQASNPFTNLLGLDYEARNAQYDSLKLSPAGWQVGMVISKEPFAVVTKVDGAGAHVKIWTGAIARDYNDLLVFWDEIGVTADGALDFHATDVEETTRNYFESTTQESYRVKAYLGKVPWANIPTDAEAQLNGVAKVTTTGLVNVYGIHFQDSDRAVATTLGSVNKSTDMPEKIPTLRLWKQTKVTKVPTDAETHWAKEDILDLMQKSIIDGYEDQTIRPNRTLSKAEFVTLLVKALGIEPVKTPVTGYEDMGSHWSKGMVASAQAIGLLDQRPADMRFSPDLPITRIEMVGLVDRILQKYEVSLPPRSQNFTDTANLPDMNKEALINVIRAGIVGGYEDGSFRPQGSLTRAEAFKVISRIIHLL